MFPGQALSIEIYREGGVRAIELGSVSLSYPDPISGKMVYPDLELVRLALPRRVYTQSHLDYVIEAVARIAGRKSEIRGYGFEYAPEMLRHFTARFKPL